MKSPTCIASCSQCFTPNSKFNLDFTSDIGQNKITQLTKDDITLRTVPTTQQIFNQHKNENTKQKKIIEKKTGIKPRIKNNQYQENPFWFYYSLTGLIFFNTLLWMHFII